MNKKVERPVCKECGGEGFYKLDGDVLCETGTFDTKEEAAEAWNRRGGNGTL